MNFQVTRRSRYLSPNTCRLPLLLISTSVSKHSRRRSRYQRPPAVRSAGDHPSTSFGLINTAAHVRQRAIYWSSWSGQMKPFIKTHSTCVLRSQQQAVVLSLLSKSMVDIGLVLFSLLVQYVCSFNAVIIHLVNHKRTYWVMICPTLLWQY